MFEEISNYPTLTDAQRIQAQQNAQRNMAAKYARKPNRADFKDFAVSRFPRVFSWAIGVVLLVIAVAAGTISGIRLYFAGKNYAALTIDEYALTVVIGAATFLAAELLVIVATIASQVYLHGRKRWMALLPVAVGTLVAFVGNWTIANPHTTWGYVETFFPPVAVLSVAFFFEIALIPELERRQANENAYQRARAEYDLVMNQPDKHPAWKNTYGLALWDMWRHIFGADHDADSFERLSRIMVVEREMSFDQFFDLSLPGIARQRAATKAAAADIDADIRALPAGQGRVKEYLKRNPNQLPKSIEDAEALADQLGVSVRTVYRGKDAVNKNGNARQ